MWTQARLCLVTHAVQLNNLTRDINDVGSDISVGDTPLSILLYADDIVLIEGSELKLQSLLTRLDQWCTQWVL